MSSFKIPRVRQLTALGLLICAFGGWIIFAIQTRYGLGKHFLTIDKKHDIVAFRHATFWQSIISASGAIMWLKISIALNLLRLITTKSFRWALWVTMGKLSALDARIDGISTNLQLGNETKRLSQFLPSSTVLGACFPSSSIVNQCRAFGIKTPSRLPPAKVATPLISLASSTHVRRHLFPLDFWIFD